MAALPEVEVLSWTGIPCYCAYPAVILGHSAIGKLNHGIGASIPLLFAKIYGVLFPGAGSGVGMTSTLSLVANIHLTRRNPVSLIHFVTNRCNARCSFCFIDFDNPETFRGEMSLSEIDRLTRTVGPHLQNINLTGGEPFARKDLLDIARSWFGNTSIRSMFITSNGSLTDRMVAFTRALLKEFPGRKIAFSLSIDAFAEQHDEIRKVKGLFGKAMASYHALRELSPDVMVNLAITVSHENYAIVDSLYDALVGQYGVRAVTCTLVREEGVYRIPIEHKREILTAYDSLSRRIADDLRTGRLEGYDSDSLQGRLMNKKNVIVNRVLRETYLEPRYISPCHAGSLFGIINADGMVRPCEILDRTLGNLRDYDMDFLRLWHDRPTIEAKHWILDSHCHCTYECAWSFNVLGNLRYQPALLAAAVLGKDW